MRRNTATSALVVLGLIVSLVAAMLLVSPAYAGGGSQKGKEKGEDRSASGSQEKRGNKKGNGRAGPSRSNNDPEGQGSGGGGRRECPSGTDFKVENPRNATFDFGSFAVTIFDFSGGTFSWTSTAGLSAVVVKGGPTANVFEFDPPATSGSATAPTNPNTGEPHGVSHITFCLAADVEPAAPQPPEDGPPGQDGLPPGENGVPPGLGDELPPGLDGELPPGLGDEAPPSLDDEAPDDLLGEDIVRTDDDVLGQRFAAPEEPRAAAREARAAEEERPGALPVTGASLAAFLLAAVALLTAGAAMSRASLGRR